MIGAVAKLAAGPYGQVAVIALVALLWLAPPLGVYLYMRGQVGAQFDLGVASCQQTNAKTILDDLVVFHVEQEGLREAALAEATTLAQNLANARAYSARMSKELRAYVEANPLSDDCRADPERVRLYNDARGAGPAASP